MTEPAPYTAPFVLEYTYKRSLGPVLSQFFTGLRDGVLLGARTPSGRILAPPTEYDPETGQAVESLVPIGPGGVVTGWTWCEQLPHGCPLQAPFAWALIKPDGADTAMTHVVVAPRDAMRTGMRVRCQWAETRSGGLWDMTFAPEDT